MSNDNDVTATEYREEIKNLAETIIQEEKEYGNDRPLTEAVWETVDSHQWIIYTAYNFDVLRHAEHEPDEWKHLVADGNSWRSVVQALAYTAMEQDVYFKVEELRNE